MNIAVSTDECQPADGGAITIPCHVCTNTGIAFGTEVLIDFNQNATAINASIKTQVTAALAVQGATVQPADKWVGFGVATGM